MTTMIRPAREYITIGLIAAGIAIAFVVIVTVVAVLAVVVVVVVAVLAVWLFSYYYCTRLSGCCWFRLGGINNCCFFMR